MLSLIGQIIVSLVLITVVVLQAKGTGLGAAFGGSSNYHTKRGVEKTLFGVTIVASILFVALAIINSL